MDRSGDARPTSRGQADAISRRDILRAGAWSSLAYVSARGLDRAMGAEQKDAIAAGWIDAHVHVWPADVVKYPLANGFKPQDMQPASFTPEQLMAHAAPCGVTRVVLIQMSYYRYDNRYMLDVIAQQPNVYRGVAIVDPESRPAESMKQLAQKGVRGFRVQPPDTSTDEWFSRPGMKEMWSCGAHEHLHMCHLMGPSAIPALDRMCRQYPQTPVVIDHMARIGVDGTIREADLDRLCRLAEHPRVRVKVSAFYALGEKKPPYHDLAAMIRRLVSSFGADRLMWASDCPFQVQEPHTYRASLELIRAGLDFLSDGQRDAILRKTAEETFFS